MSSSSSSTSQGQGQGQPDLVVSAVRVNGRVPDGKDDCKDGKNDVAVVVKNWGTTNAEKFAVRLAVDGGEAAEEAVAGSTPARRAKSA